MTRRGGLCRVSWSASGPLELKSTWREAHAIVGKRRCIVDLIQVTSIDRNGEAILAEIMNQGAEFISGDVYTEAIFAPEPPPQSEAKSREQKTR